jgi:hypothetical protein
VALITLITLITLNIAPTTLKSVPRCAGGCCGGSLGLMIIRMGRDWVLTVKEDLGARPSEATPRGFGCLASWFD